LSILKEEIAELERKEMKLIERL